MERPMTTYPRVIAFCGANGSGKDTVAHALMSRLSKEGKTYSLRPFAANVKTVCGELTNEPVSHFTDSVLKNQKIGNLGLTRRGLMCSVTDLGFKISADYWFELWDKQVKARNRLVYCDFLLVTDYRYTASLKFIREYNGILVHVKTDRIEDRLSSLESLNLKNLTKNADITILNNWSIQDIKLGKLMRYIKDSKQPPTNYPAP